MARLYLFVEGQTEQTFADTVLKPHLALLEVFMHKPVLIARSRKKGRTHRGGGRNYEPMKNDIARFLHQEKGDDVFFTTMIDLYALHGGFPSRAEADKLKRDPPKRVRFLEEAWSADIGDPRFIPYIQLHEFEACLFCDLSHFLMIDPDGQKGIDRLRKIVDSVASPELIDDGPNTAPSKRIIAEFPDYKATKAVDGPQIAERIGLAAIRGKCPHFSEWLTTLENLAGK